MNCVCALCFVGAYRQVFILNRFIIIIYTKWKIIILRKGYGLFLCDDNRKVNLIFFFHFNQDIPLLSFENLVFKVVLRVYGYAVYKLRRTRC